LLLRDSPVRALPLEQGLYPSCLIEIKICNGNFLHLARPRYEILVAS
jgi:hypothetical protein